MEAVEGGELAGVVMGREVERERVAKGRSERGAWRLRGFKSVR